jgi:hypothetical protein
MKQLFSVFVLVMAPAVFAAPAQTAPTEAAPQANIDARRSPSGKATSHDRHMRKHRAGNHLHRRRTTAKNHSS